MLRRGDTAAGATDFAADLATLLAVSPDHPAVETALGAAVTNRAVVRSGSRMRAPGAAGLEETSSPGSRPCPRGPWSLVWASGAPAGGPNCWLTSAGHTGLWATNSAPLPSA
jgi:hypothetical protein